jgi:D-mannonate dehydratase
MIPIDPGLMIAAQVTPEPTEADLAFIRRMGVEYVVLWTGGDKASYAYYDSRRQLFEDAGIQVYGFGSSSVHNQDAIVLNLPNRDEKIKEYKAHLRNVDGPLPHFVETFLDAGCMDMHKVVGALREVNFDGVMIPDHIPMMDDDRRVGTAYSIGYMKALVEEANAAFGG